MYTSLISSAVFPLHECVKRHTSVAIRRDMEKSQWWPVDRLLELQAARLAELVSQAQRHVPYYRDMFDAHGLVAADIKGVSDLRRLPLLTKSLIRAHTEALKHEHASTLARFNTGGSSGEPLIFHIGKERVSHDVAAKWRATRWWGVDIGDPEIVVWGSPIELGAQDHVRKFRDRIMRTELLSAFEMSEAKLDRFVEQIRQRRPRMLFGYPSALSLIARHADARGRSMNDLGVRVAFVTSERLYDDQRATIERIFGCRVANGYGGRDAGFIAHECPAGGMHITAEDIIVEIVDADGRCVAPGQSGEVVVTHLATKDFPFIRYRTGDIAALDDRPCTCGRGLPLLKEIQGRTTDFVLAADGTVLHGLALIYVLRDVPGVKQFKIIQETLCLTRVQLVCEDDLDPACLHDIEGKLRARLGQEVRIILEQVDDIAPEASGKYRYVVSHVAARATEENHA